MKLLRSRTFWGLVFIVGGILVPAAIARCIERRRSLLGVAVPPGGWFVSVGILDQPQPVVVHCARHAVPWHWRRLAFPGLFTR